MTCSGGASRRIGNTSSIYSTLPVSIILYITSYGRVYVGQDIFRNLCNATYKRREILQTLKKNHPTVLLH
jgi:hypothetical protein